MDRYYESMFGFNQQEIEKGRHPFHHHYQNTYLSQSHDFTTSQPLLLETLKSSHIKRTMIFQCPIFGFHTVDGSEIWFTS